MPDDPQTSTRRPASRSLTSKSAKSLPSAEWEAEYYSFRWATQVEIVSIQEGLLIIRCPDILYDEIADPPAILNTRCDPIRFQ